MPLCSACCTCMLLNGYYLLSGLRHSQPSNLRCDMMVHSQVRWAILLSFIPLKVRRMKSLALLWATAGPDCRSLKLYWVSAKALTLPISHHGSSQLSLPSGLIPSPERINTQSLCSRYTWAFPLLKSRLRSTLISSFLARLLCITTNVSSSVISKCHLSAGQRELSFLIESWDFIVVLKWASCDFVEWCFSSNNRHFCCPGSTPWTLNHRQVISPSCHLSNSPPLLRPMKEDGHPEVW